jgi:uncharacterized transporter YbjL
VSIDLGVFPLVAVVVGVIRVLVIEFVSFVLGAEGGPTLLLALVLGSFDGNLCLICMDNTC